MKRAFLYSVGLLTLAGSCFANAPHNKYYVGGDIQGIFLKPEFIINNNSRLGVSGFAGYRWENIGLELGLTGIQNANYTINNLTNGSGTSSVKAFNIYLDTQFYKQIASQLELKGLVGLGALSSKTDLVLYNSRNLLYSYESTGVDINLRLGAGLQYNISNHWNTSLMYKYQFIADTLSNMQTVALSLAYVF